MLMVIVMGTISLVLLKATLARTASTALMNERNNQYVATLYAAEAATEKVIARMRYDYTSGNDSYVTNNLSIYRGYVPTTAEDPYWGKFEFRDPIGSTDKTYVQCASNRVYTPLQSQYYGLNGWRTIYRVISNVRQVGSPYAISAAVQQDVELDSIPVFQFAIFYNSRLEFTWAAPFVIRGRTHANGHIFTGSASDLTFKELVTCTGIITKTNWDGHTQSEYTGKVIYATNISGGYITNVPVLQLPIGTNNSTAAVREIVNIPPGGEDPSSPMGQQRYYNKAGINLFISNSTVTAVIKGSFADASPLVIQTNFSTTNYANIVTNFPFLTLTNSFTDAREGKTVKATQVDIGKYGRWLSTNPIVTTKFPSGGGSYPNILYVADFRTRTSTELAAVRLSNAQILPTNGPAGGQPTGLSVVTPNPLYVWGHYNCPNGSHLGDTNTTQTFPASLVSDALTILSPNWADSRSTNTLANRDAISTTVNAAILTGVVFSTGPTADKFSGGVMNLPRLLEDWGNGGTSIVLTLNTSIVNLFDSVRATNQFQNPGVYYYAPSRQFSFDQNFTDPSKQPPGTPMLGAILRSKWSAPPPNTVTYAGP